MKRTLFAVLFAVAVIGLSAAGASAKPGHGKNSFTGTFQCTDGSEVSVALSGNGRFSTAHLVPSNAPAVPLRLDIVGTENGQVVFESHVRKHQAHPRKTTLTCSGTFTDTDPATGQPITIQIDVVVFLPHGRR
ncbi:MAG TPA: hypothetical protein VIW19_09745 [Gaiellaceae bacterium]|jgi:hypothetical protein